MDNYLRKSELTSGLPQGSVLGPLLFLACVNDVWRIIESNIRLFPDDYNHTNRSAILISKLMLCRRKIRLDIGN
jgi:hypothetical protein